MKKIGLLETKQALSDDRFRNSLPDILKPEIDKYLSNPSCPCNVPLFRKILREYPEYIKNYYPGREIPASEITDTYKNNFSVVNCNVRELESYLKKLEPGRKQIAIARYEDQVTVIINELDI